MLVLEPETAGDEQPLDEGSSGCVATCTVAALSINALCTTLESRTTCSRVTLPFRSMIRCRGSLGGGRLQCTRRGTANSLVPARILDGTFRFVEFTHCVVIEIAKVTGGKLETSGACVLHSDQRSPKKPDTVEASLAVPKQGWPRRRGDSMTAYRGIRLRGQQAANKRALESEEALVRQVSLSGRIGLSETLF